MKSKIAMICPIGGIGNVVTMTLNELLIKLNIADDLKAHVGGNFSIDHDIVVIVPHTDISRYSYDKDDKEGRDAYGQIIISVEDDEIGKLQKQWDDGSWDKGKIIWSAKGYKWHPGIEGSTLSHPKYKQDKPTTIENITCYLLPIHPKGSGDTPEIFTSAIVPDIHDEASNNQFQDLIYGLCAVLEKLGYDIHISLAGGRKTMSAYQMTASTLFPVDEELSHVLEPTLLQLDDFICKYHKNDFFNSLSPKQRKEILDEKIRPAYQPFPGLYVSVPVQHISFAGVSKAAANFIDFNNRVEIAFKSFRGNQLKDILLVPSDRKVIYKIGEIYRENLQRRDDFITQKVEQGLAGGMMNSFLKHEVGDRLFGKILQDLDLIECRFNSQNDTGGQNNVKEVRKQVNMLHDTLKAIQLSAILSEDQIRARIHGNGEPIVEKDAVRWENPKLMAICDVINLALNMCRVKEDLKANQIKIVDDYEDECAEVKCIPTVLALAFNNIIRNFINQVEKNRKGDKMLIKIKGIDGDLLQIEFVDNGPGFDRKRWPDLEELFEWGTSTSSKKENQGLGLRMVRKIVRAHGTADRPCDIKADDNPNGGAIFRVTLPLHKEESL